MAERDPETPVYIEHDEAGRGGPVPLFALPLWEARGWREYTPVEDFGVESSAQQESSAEGSEDEDSDVGPEKADGDAKADTPSKGAASAAKTKE